MAPKEHRLRTLVLVISGGVAAVALGLLVVPHKPVLDPRRWRNGS